MQSVTSFKIDGDVDDVFYDGTRHRLYAICGEGSVDVIDKLIATLTKYPPGFRRLQARAPGLFVPERNSLFVAVPQQEKQTAELRKYTVRAAANPHFTQP